ncbi:hypothetical protein D3C78_833970 [compost metagenome]
MLQQTVPAAIGIRLSSNSRIDVVVHFNVAHAVILHQAPYHFVCMSNYLGIAIIKLIATAILHSFAMPHEKPAIIRLRKLRAVNPHDLKLQPQAWNHSFASNVIQYIFDSFREAFIRRQPFSYSVPPLAGCIPARINTKVFASYIRSRINKRQ